MKNTSIIEILSHEEEAQLKKYLVARKIKAQRY